MKKLGGLEESNISIGLLVVDGAGTRAGDKSLRLFFQGATPLRNGVKSPLVRALLSVFIPRWRSRIIRFLARYSLSSKTL